MMHQSEIVRKTVLFASVAAFAGLAMACSSEVTRFGGTNNPLGNPFQNRSTPDPILTNSINRPRQPGSYIQQPQPPFASAPTGGVMTQTLPPPNAPLTTGAIPASPAARGAIPARLVSPGAVAGANYPALSAAAAARAPNVVGSNQGWTAVGGTPVTVQPGETLNTLSQRYGVPASAIMAVNGFSNVQQAQPGQQVMIPAYNNNSAVKAAPMPQRIPQVAAAPIQPMPVPAQIMPKAAPVREIMPQPMSNAERQAAQKIAEARAQEQAYKGDIAARLAEARRQEEAKKRTEAQKAIEANKLAEIKLAEAKKLEAKRIEALKLAQAQKLKSNDVEEYTGSIAEKSGTKVTAPSKIAEKPSETARSEENEEGGASFRWPARGKVISGFGSRGTGGANDGINIAVPEGTPVRAAEGGTVVHADDALRGYGKLVLVRHPSGYVSVYAHNSELNVKRGESVKRGQIIARSGQTGNVTAPQLHFEIRKGATPVDPTKYLAAN